MNEPGHPHLYRGWLVAEPFDNLPVVHFLKVKKGCKREGVATALMERFFKDFNYVRGEHNCVYTHSTKDIKRYPWLQKRVKKEWSGVYLPWFKYTLATPGWEG